jgi:hypothetical protein
VSRYIFRYQGINYLRNGAPEVISIKWAGCFNSRPAGATLICITVSWKAVIMANHLCLVLDVVGFSYEHLRLSSPTKSLPRHIVQRAVAGVLEELEKLHDCGLIHGGSYFPLPPERENIYTHFAHI